MGQKILIVDDDLFIREIYTDKLIRAGYDVDSAVDGEEGIKKMQNGGYSLVLLDMMMPKVNGLKVLETLEMNPPSIENGKIILLTNNTSDSEIEEGLKKGASSFLVKIDLTPDQLLEKINGVMSST